MNLKESYRYANFLDKLFEDSCYYLDTPEFMTNTKQHHMRAKMDSAASDEVVVKPKPYDVAFTPMDLVDFTVALVAEREALADAIAVAKASAEINIDNAISMNKKKQKFAKLLSEIARLKPHTEKVNGVAHKFNQEGNQIRYHYEIEETVTIDFDRNDVRSLVRKYRKETDAISAKLDAIEINTIVDFTPRFDLNDSLEDAVVGQKQDGSEAI